MLAELPSSIYLRAIYEAIERFKTEKDAIRHGHPNENQTGHLEEEIKKWGLMRVRRSLLGTL